MSSTEQKLRLAVMKDVPIMQRGGEYVSGTEQKLRRRLVAKKDVTT